MPRVTIAVTCFLAAIGGFAFGIFLAASLGLHDVLPVFSLAGLFALVCLVIAYRVTTQLVHRMSGRMLYWLAGFIVLAALATSAFLFIKASAS